ncbi:MAG TPA: DUF397 domain-containing protein [Trebonia sp.]|jgi:hypothetical protein|nr:DUF397 domain-containing protein [Trebonia sp.]
METAEPMSWRKSSYSSSNGGDCVEVATTSHIIAVRDSKDPAGAVLTVTLGSWRAFTQSTKSLRTKLTGQSSQEI